MRAVNLVRPSLVRVEADEVTYNLHIILRFELERRLIGGELEAGEVPAAWNERFRELFGLQVPDDRSGCLQDVHWAAGLLGYFPTYGLGNLYAAQFFQAARAALPGLEDQVAGGDFHPLREWLRDKIHSQGMRFHPRALVERVTGRPPESRPFLEYLERKYGALYGF